MGIYVIGDVHGCLTQLHALCKQIYNHRLEDPSRSNADVIFVGDYVDRGPDSKGVIEYIKTWQTNTSDYRVIALKGNHEDMMLFDNPEGFLLNGGIQTLMSYGVDVIGLNGRARVRELIGEDHYQWAKKLPIHHVVDNVAVAHAGIHPNKLCEDNTEQYLLWSRDLRKFAHDHYKFTVHGHTPMDRARITEHTAFIDTGCVFRGVLSALWIPDTVNPNVENMQLIDHTGKITTYKIENNNVSIAMIEQHTDRPKS